MIIVPGSASLPPRPEKMFPDNPPAKKAAEALKRLAGRSRSTKQPPGWRPAGSADAVDIGPDDSHGYILYLEDLTVSFDGFRALNALTLYVQTGELLCIIGPNGAGKTTMMDVITGKTRPDHGSAWFGQTLDLLSHTEPEIAQAGIGRKFQKPTVFEKHSAFENLELALAGNRAVWANLVARLSGEQRDRIGGVLAQIGLADEAGRPAGSLSHGQKQWLEIGMLLMQNPRLLLVDEPVAGMTPQEVEKTAELLVSLAGEHSVVVVEHDMEFVRRIARRVTVLHQGSVLAEGTMDEVQANPKVVEVYLGEA
jgi:urea transport system ATP-binding protein